MKKIIISLIVVGCLLSTTPLSIGSGTQVKNINLNNSDIINKNNIVKKENFEIPADVTIFNKEDVEKQNLQGTQANTVITGHVFDSRTGEPIDDASIGFLIEEPNGYIGIYLNPPIYSNESGGYIFYLNWTSMFIDGYAFVSKTGYNEITYYYFTYEGETTNIDFYLDTKPKAATEGNHFWGTAGEVNEPLWFNGTGSKVNGNIVLYEWDFNGDGIYDWSSTDTGVTTHSFDTVGNYTATLRVTDDEGFSATAKMDVYVLKQRQYTHDKILIWGDDGFKKSNSGVVSGSGTEDDPYIIENWEIQGQNSGYESDYGIKIMNTEAYVIIRNVTVNDATYCIWLNNAKNVIIEDCNIFSSGNGIFSNGASGIFRKNLILGGNGQDLGATGIYPSSLFTKGGGEVIIDQNIIVGYTWGIQIDADSYSIIIKNNIIKHCDHGIKCSPLTSFNGVDDSHIFIYHNVLGPNWLGIAFENYYQNETGDFFVEYNEIPTTMGIYKDTGDQFCGSGSYYRVGHLSVNNNNIVYAHSDILGVWEAAVFNWDVGDPLDVKYNWWGSSDGPGCDGWYGPRDWPRTDYGGVEYEPYLTSPVENAGPTTNPSPNTPQVNGPVKGKAGVQYTFKATTSDPNGEAVYYLFDWDDGTTSGWVGPYVSGDKASISHTWQKKGSYQVRVIAKDSSGCISDFSNPLKIVMPRSRMIQNPLLLKLFERFPHAFPILRHLLNLN